MNQNEWLEKLSSDTEIQETFSIFERIKSKIIVNEDTFFEYLIIRIFAGMSNFKKFEFSMKLDKNFEPISVVGNKADVIVTYDQIELVIEPTLRPVSGKADHFSHIIDPKKQMGLLIAKNVKKIDAQIWNTYKAYSKKHSKLFMICDVPFLLKLLEEQKDSNKKFLEFIETSKKVWESEESWKNIREQIISLIT